MKDSNNKENNHDKVTTDFNVLHLNTKKLASYLYFEMHHLQSPPSTLLQHLSKEMLACYRAPGYQTGASCGVDVIPCL